MTPRDYLSWTQLNLIERSADKYVDVYMGEQTVPVNRGMALGKKVSEAIEAGELTGDPVLDLLVNDLPRHNKVEYEIETTLGGVPLYGKIDSFCTRTKRKLIEYKTGVNRWTQTMADAHAQIDFYCTLVYGKFGIRPEDMELKLVYIPSTYNKDGNLELVGHIQTFKTTRTLGDILKMNARQAAAWNKIKNLSIEYIT